MRLIRFIYVKRILFGSPGLTPRRPVIRITNGIGLAYSHGAVAAFTGTTELNFKYLYHLIGSKHLKLTWNQKMKTKFSCFKSVGTDSPCSDSRVVRKNYLSKYFIHFISHAKTKPKYQHFFLLFSTRQPIKKCLVFCILTLPVSKE